MSRKVSTRDAARNLEWDLHINDDGTWDIERIQVALLVDIRAELKRLNNVLQCPNFIAVPAKLEHIKTELKQIRLNTRKRKKRVVGKPALRVVSRS